MEYQVQIGTRNLLKYLLTSMEDLKAIYLINHINWLPIPWERVKLNNLIVGLGLKDDFWGALIFRRVFGKNSSIR